VDAIWDHVLECQIEFYRSLHPQRDSLHSTHYSNDSVKMKIQNTIFGMNEELKVLACLTCL
jgi:hypothetical protein